MTKSETIRQPARQGLPVAEIVGCVGAKYQHAYNVLPAGCSSHPVILDVIDILP